MVPFPLPAPNILLASNILFLAIHLLLSDTVVVTDEGILAACRARDGPLSPKANSLQRFL